ncbi:MAG: carbohydrate ABC transporter permease [Thermomicrobiales bacterium]
MHHHKYRLIIPFVVPGLLLYAVFVIWPYCQALYVSLTDWSGMTPTKDFIGLDNFVRMKDDPKFWNALKHNGLLLIVLPLTTLPLAMLFAALVTQKMTGIRGSGTYRFIFFAPQVMSAIVIGVLWSFVYHPSIGLLNAVLKLGGLGALTRAWLGSPQTVLWSIMAVMVWAGVGFFMILFMAGMQSIPADFYEAATLDGAGRWRLFRDITLPLLRDQVQVAGVFIGIGALDVFGLVQVMAEGGGPGRGADVVARYMYDTAFTQSKFGYATAIGIVLLILTLVLSLITIKVTSRDRIEY